MCAHATVWQRARLANAALPLSLFILFSRSAFACLALIHRTCKDLGASSKEIAAQEKRIESTRTDAGKDEHDVKKQQEVLKEYQDGVKDEVREKPINAVLKALLALQESRRTRSLTPLAFSLHVCDTTPQVSRLDDAIGKLEGFLGEKSEDEPELLELDEAVKAKEVLATAQETLAKYQED